MTLLSLQAAASAQDGSISIEVQREEDIGLEGFVRKGTWAPMRLTLKNNHPSLRTVSVDWLAPDVDGDQVVARRSPVVIAGNGTTVVRLYAMPAHNSNPLEDWRIRVVDPDSEELLAVARVAPPSNRVLHPREGAIGLAGNAGFSGLDRFRDPIFQHEKRVIISIPDLALLPDRWYGMQLLDALVWTSGARSLTDPGVPLTAIKDWVRRGGHLVISLTPADANWSDERLEDLLPPVRISEAKEVPVPEWLYLAVRRSQVTNVNFSVRELTPLPDAKLRDLAMLEPFNPDKSSPVIDAPPPPNLIATHNYGFGRVTLIGLDISDPRLNKNSDYQLYGLPRLWQCVFNWRTPAYLNAKELSDARKLADPRMRDYIDLTNFVSPRIAMKTKAAATLGLAIVFFAIYWFAAGPISYAVLRSRKMLHHSWLIFGIVVIVFSAASWMGAILLKPGRIEIEHFSVIDVDATGRDGAYVRAHSWCSLFIPEHTTADLVVGPIKRDEDGQVREVINLNTISSPGLPGVPRGSFADERRYVINPLSTGVSNSVPFRSTAKQFELRYFGRAGSDRAAQQWWPPEGSVSASGMNMPTGRLTHRLPATLTNVTFIYCPGDGHVARVWRDGSLQWAPGEPYTIKTSGMNVLPLAMGPIERPKSLHQTKGLLTDYEDREFMKEGWLGQVIGRRVGRRPQYDEDGNEINKNVVPDSGTMVDYMELMTFLDAAPPPNFIDDARDFSGAGIASVHFSRATGRDLDLTHLLATRKLIIMGYMPESSPLPLPLTVDGETPRSNGWTTVRFILPVEEE